MTGREQCGLFTLLQLIAMGQGVKDLFTLLSQLRQTMIEQMR